MSECSEEIDIDIDIIVEQIIIKVTDNNIKIQNIFNYVDNFIDIWNIDIGEHYLDEICDIVICKIEKRKKLEKTPIKNCNHIEFKITEEYQEKIMLDTIEKKYNKLVKQTIKITSPTIPITIPIPITMTMIEGEELDSSLNSWDERLERIENIYRKYEFSTNNQLSSSS